MDGTILLNDANISKSLVFPLLRTWIPPSMIFLNSATLFGFIIRRISPSGQNVGENGSMDRCVGFLGEPRNELRSTFSEYCFKMDLDGGFVIEEGRIGEDAIWCSIGELSI